MSINCELLVDGKCSDYENRPAVCNSDTMYDTFYVKLMTREEYESRQRQSCIVLRGVYEDPNTS